MFVKKNLRYVQGLGVGSVGGGGGGWVEGGGGMGGGIYCQKIDYPP